MAQVHKESFNIISHKKTADHTPVLQSMEGQRIWILIPVEDHTSSSHHNRADALTSKKQEWASEKQRLFFKSSLQLHCQKETCLLLLGEGGGQSSPLQTHHRYVFQLTPHPTKMNQPNKLSVKINLPFKITRKYISFSRN